ncbi:MAG TPA: hypothetical protein VMV12_07755 [Candidatus Micrarchaeaceae archaeon]|nr:hypothetical protein [Candidatus Micrarchaeaceae archaeon]
MAVDAIAGSRECYSPRSGGVAVASGGEMGAAVLACLLGAAFSVVVWRRWWRSRRPAFAAWGAGLAIFAAAALTQAWGEAFGFSVPLFRAFYLLGGVLGVIYLALGTTFLMAPARVARAAAAVLIALTLVLAVDAALVPVNASKLSTSKGVLGGALIGHGTPLFVAAVLFNILGTLVLAGGSAFSAYRFIRSSAGIDRVICNVLLTVGALVVALGFSLAKTVGGSLSELGVFESVGSAIMFAGFLSLGRFGAVAPAASRSAASAAIED